jgi:hypothetical protein
MTRFRSAWCPFGPPRDVKYRPTWSHLCLWLLRQGKLRDRSSSCLVTKDTASRFPGFLGSSSVPGRYTVSTELRGLCMYFTSYFVISSFEADSRAPKTIIQGSSAPSPSAPTPCSGDKRCVATSRFLPWAVQVYWVRYRHGEGSSEENSGNRPASQRSSASGRNVRHCMYWM